MKLLKIIKKLIVFALILVMSINTVAAVVFGDDGANFITKEEFENMKDGFAAQIDTYQSSLDNKIDGAIAAYLAGLPQKNFEEATNLIKVAEEAWKKKVLWTGATTVDTNRVSDDSCFLITVVNAFGTQNVVGLFTAGYGPSEDAYLSGYNVLKIRNGQIVSNVKYSPKLTYVVSYGDMTATGQFASNLEFWKERICFNSNQKDTATKYWVGYKDDVQQLAAYGGIVSVSLYYTATETFDNFVMAPNASCMRSVWDPDNTDSSASGVGTQNTSPVYETGYSGGTNSSSVVQSVKEYPLYTVDWDISIPWVTNNNVYNEQVINFNGASVKPCAMKYGLPVVQSDKSAQVRWTINAKRGKIGWYLNTPTLYDDIPDEQKMEIIADGPIEGSIDMDENDILFFIYLPDDVCELDFEELYYI